MSRLVIIRDTDADGIAGAWLLNRFIGPKYDEVLLIPQRAGEDNPPYEQLTIDDDVILVDRTYPLSTLINMSRSVRAVTVLDHHKSRMDEYAQEPTVNSDDVKALDLSPSKIYFEYENISVLVDTSHSACMLAHYYCMEHADNVPVTPYWFISYIEDRDMWWFKLPDSRAVNAALHYITSEYYSSMFDHFNHITTLSETSDASYRMMAVNTGRTVLSTQLQIIKHLAHGPTVIRSEITKSLYTSHVPAELHGKYSLSVALVCCPFELISDLGNYMLNCTDEGYSQPEVVMCYNYLADSSQYVYSIRSKVPMDWFAKAHGGGGHPNACGFKSTYTPLQLTHWIVCSNQPTTYYTKLHLLHVVVGNLNSQQR